MEPLLSYLRLKSPKLPECLYNTTYKQNLQGVYVHQQLNED